MDEELRDDDLKELELEEEDDLEGEPGAAPLRKKKDLIDEDTESLEDLADEEEDDLDLDEDEFDDVDEQ